MKIIRTAVGSVVTWGFIKELQKLEVEVIGVDIDPLSFAFQLLDNHYVIPRADNKKFIDAILTILDIEEPDAIISGPEEELLVLAKNIDLLHGTVLLAPEYQYLKICTDKLKMDKFLRQIGVPTPRRYELNNIELPCIEKPRFGRGGKGVIKINSEEAIRDSLNRVSLLQEYIEGDEYSVDVLADREGNTLNIVPRLRMEIVKGKSVRSKTVYDLHIIEYTRRIVKALRLFGPSCIQCIKNETGIYFIDVNPRFGGGSILSIKADPTFLPNMIQLIKGENPLPSDDYKEDLTMLRYYKEVYVDGK